MLFWLAAAHYMYYYPSIFFARRDDFMPRFPRHGSGFGQRTGVSTFAGQRSWPLEAAGYYKLAEQTTENQTYAHGADSKS
jgi:hypothetical protein